MTANERKLSDVVGKDVFTDRGSYAGKVADVRIDMSRFRIDTLTVDVARGSFISSVVGGKKGVVIPFQMVKAVDDIIIIKHIPLPTAEEQKVAVKA